MKRYIIAVLALAILFLVPVAQLKAQSCDPDRLASVVNPSQVLRYGQRNNDVRNLQACLIEAGYNIPAGATGYYGNQTRTAVKQFYSEWYGAWHGNWVGPQGVRHLTELVRGAVPEEVVPTPEEVVSTPEEVGAQPQVPTLSTELLAQVLQKIQAGDIQGALALLLSALGGVSQPVTPPSEVTPPAEAQEGFLVVEQDPSATGVVVREGESANVFGLRFRADNAPVTVKSIFLRWTGNEAPHRVLSKLEVVDSQGNVLYSTNVTPTTFYQDSNLNYYLPITGLNVDVPVNQYVSVFVKVTVAGVLPSGANSGGFEVKANDVRARDRVGVDRFGPASAISSTFQLQQSLAGSAYFVVARNVNTPQKGYVFGNPTDGKAYNVKLLSFDVTAKNDNIRVTNVTINVTSSVAITDIVSSLYLRYGNQTVPVTPSTTVAFNVVPNNLTINKDQTVTFEVFADLTGGSTSTDKTVKTSVTEVKGQNSLGGSVTASVSVSGEELVYRTLGPEISGFTASTSYTPPSQSASSSYSVTMRFNVTPRGGNIYMGTTTNPISTFAELKLQKDDGNYYDFNGGVVVKVYQGNTDVTQTLTVGSGNYWTLSEGQTYTFEITAVQNGAPSSGAGLYRWVIKSLKWHDGSGTVTMGWTEREMHTGYTNVQ